MGVYKHDWDVLDIPIASSRHTRGWENSWKLLKLETKSRVCINVSSSLNPSGFTRGYANTEKVLYCLNGIDWFALNLSHLWWCDLFSLLLSLGISQMANPRRPWRKLTLSSRCLIGLLHCVLISLTSIFIVNISLKLAQMRYSRSE